MEDQPFQIKMKIEPVVLSIKFMYFYSVLSGLGLPIEAKDVIYLQHNFTAVHFIQHKNHVLNVEGINSFSVAFPTECALRCMHNKSCLSFNLGIKKHQDSRNVLCKTLPATAFTVMQQLEKSKNFDHWSIFVSISFSFTTYLWINFFLFLTLMPRLSSEDSKRMGVLVLHMR